MKSIILLLFFLQIIFTGKGQETLGSVTSRGNYTGNVLIAGGEGMMGNPGDAGLVLGLLSTPRPNDVHCFISWKNSNNTTTSGLAGTLLLQARSDIANVPIDFVTGQGLPQLRMRIAGNGNIGLGGVITPLAQLHVQGDTYANGKVFIGVPDGTTTTKIAGYSLAVDGTAVFVKAIVKLKNDWADYVFKPNYDLMPLHELQQFILKNQHLPEVPTEAEVNETGIDLGANQTLLLKKVEELTLYIINQNQRLEELQKLVTAQSKQIDELKDRK